MAADKAAAYLVVFITTPNSEEAHKIADELLQRRQAACINIVPAVDSFFWWQGKIDSAQESLLIVKTKASLLNNIINLVSRTHSYDVPEIIALPIVGGHHDYLEWLSKEVKQVFRDQAHDYPRRTDQI